MPKKSKKRKFSPEHMAALRAAHAKRRGKPRSKEDQPQKEILKSPTSSLTPVAKTLSGQLDRLEQLLERFEALT